MKISTTSKQNDTKSYMRRRYYDRHNGLYETRNNGRRASRLYEDYNDFDESDRPSCGSRLFERIMLRENIAEIVQEFTKQLNSKGGGYLLKVPSAAERVLYMTIYRHGQFARFEHDVDKNFASMNTKAYDEIQSSIQNDTSMEHNEAIQTNKMKDAKALVYSLSAVLSQKEWKETPLGQAFSNAANVERIAANIAGLPDNIDELMNTKTEISVPKDKILYNRRRAAGAR